MPGTQHAAVSPHRNLSMWVSLWGIFVTNVTLTILTIALPEIADDFDAEPAIVNWVTLGPMLVVSLLTPASGRAADLYGRKRVWMLGFCTAMLGMVGSGLAPSLPLLLFARVITGLGTAVMMPAAMAIATQDFAPEERATPLGYVTGALALSPMLGILLGGFVIDFFSWRWLFAGQVVLGLPAIALAAWVFDEHRYPVEGRFDTEGALLLGGSSLSLMLAATLWPALGESDPRTWGSLLVAILLGALAVRTERRAQNPVLPPHILADPQIAMSVVARLSLNAVYMGAFITLPYLLTELWQLTPFAVSTLLLPRPLAMGVTGPLMGRLSSRVGAAKLVVIGAAGIVLSTAMYMGLTAQQERGWLILALVIAGTSLALSVSGTAAIATARVDDEELGTVGGLLTLTATLANVVGMAAVYALVEHFGGPQRHEAYRAAFGCGVVLASVGLLAALRLWVLDRAETAKALSAT